ncbi:murein DD-endopeptidase MepM [Zophobihabitans entericus]|uniref:Murein DD-endopeptidase MepM n=1 Tax=Zophobihabitans entericus TaxID=1635327 RepID=A0A6G9IA41_9GAMM|nr:murein DD-endopeptidase MepM [Zophobihabitans entericus]QIQ21086.1 murein DD-endopeptidase MepM [Zophobihabitans entericus]
MQQVEASESSLADKNKVPYYAISGVIALTILFAVLWKPLNPARVVHIPLNGTSVVNEGTVPVVVGNASIEIIEDPKTVTPTESLDQPTPEDEIISDEIDAAIDIEIEDNVVHYVVEKGDTLSGILTQFGISRSDIYLLTKQHKQLANLRIGQQISWTTDDDKSLQTFSWIISPKNIRVYERKGESFVERTETREGEWSQTVLTGTIGSNFVADARSAGLTSGEISTITKALQWQLDFRRLQKGDQFSVVLSREMFENKHENSQLLAVRIQNASREYYAILADDGQYYDVKGLSLSRSFLRHPLEKPARISSQFNPRRVNPVTKQVTSHNGVDYAVSRGTPVLAAGDGEVVIAKYSGSAGNYIAIRHGRQYLTKYMHLDRIQVRAGQQVRKGDQIGLSGNTGRSTGPHLHYELHINGKPVNPVTATLPQSDGLTGKAKTTYLELVKTIQPQLAFTSESASSTGN